MTYLSLDSFFYLPCLSHDLLQMPSKVDSEYYSVGGNRHSNAADWSPTSGLLAFGADQNVAIWKPGNGNGNGSHTGHGGGIHVLLSAHGAKVSAVRFTRPLTTGSQELLVSGSAGGEIALWKHDDADADGVSQATNWTCLDRKLKAHDGTVNAIDTLQLLQSNLFATGGADATVKIWRVDDTEQKIEVLTTIALKPRFIPLTLALGSFVSHSSPPPQQDAAFLVVGGTRNDMQIYALDNLLSSSTQPQAKLCATLTGHEAWIRSLALTPTPAYSSTGRTGYLLASASQDKYVRIWRFRENSAESGATAALPKRQTATLTAKIQSVTAGNLKYDITFEALLVGHEDWIYSATWAPPAQPASDPSTSPPPQLLTASADGSLSIFSPDSLDDGDTSVSSGLWISTTRLGEISSQKGATTATGSAGGFFTALFSPDGRNIASLGRTGSWRLWHYDDSRNFWVQRAGVSGHVGSVNGICWAGDGSYLLSTGSDQTTRLHARWATQRSWREFSRPQIHGYDLNCVASTTGNQFASGADEKLLRVFNEPRDIANLLHRLSGAPLPLAGAAEMPDTAAIPVLGLSNKAVDEDESQEQNGMNGDAVAGGDGEETNGVSSSNGVHPSSLLQGLDEPPTEDLLARHTLWPEHEKLYGHGAEISACAATSLDNGGGVLATACKASALDHAVIRLYDTTSWHEIKPPLSAHSLTVTALAFSPPPTGRDKTPPGQYLLSVGRDRAWAVFKHSASEEASKRRWIRVAINQKAHARMILDATWLDCPDQPSFVTAGRDKVAKIWSRSTAVGGNSDDSTNEVDEFVLVASIARKHPVTALSATRFSTSSKGNRDTAPQSSILLALGEDDGTISLHTLSVDDNDTRTLTVSQSIDVPRQLCPSRTANRLAWRPVGEDGVEGDERQLAIAAADGSVRILTVTP